MLVRCINWTASARYCAISAGERRRRATAPRLCSSGTMAGPLGDFLKGLCRPDQRLERGLAGQTRHRRPDFKEDQQRLDPTTEFAQFLCMLQIGIEARRTELALCLVEAIVEDVVNSVEAAIESVAQRLVAQWLTFGAH
jgi:hypothetical protein